MSRVVPGGIRLIQKVTTHTKLHLPRSAAACAKHSQFLLPSSACTLKTVHLSSWTCTQSNKDSVRALHKELQRSTLQKISPFHTGSLHNIQKQERAEKRATTAAADEAGKHGVAQSERSLDKDGRLVPHKVLDLLDEKNELLGSLSRGEAVKLSEDRNLKLVLINPQSRPYPTYKLMSQEDFEEEQKRIRKQLAKNAKPQVKEVRLACGIGEHDLRVKKRHMIDWFEDPKHDTQVKVVVKGGKPWKPVTEEEQLALIRELMSGMEDRITFGNKPKQIGKNHPSLTVLLRKMSVKEKAAYNKQKNMEESLNSMDSDA